MNEELLNHEHRDLRMTVGPSSTAQQAELQFACVTADGRVKTLWGDNALLLLSSGGEAFAHAPPGAPAPTCQISEFALSRAAPLLAQALRLRNTHADRPAFCRALARRAAAEGDVFPLGYPIRRVYWPASFIAALNGGYAELLDGGRVAVRSVCGAARAVLDGGARARLAVCYPLLLPRLGSVHGAGQYEHVWQTQVFSTRHCPERWAPALALATAVARAAGEGNQPRRGSGRERPDGGRSGGGGGDGLERAARREARCSSDGGVCSGGADRGGDEYNCSPTNQEPFSEEELLAPTEAMTDLPEVIWPAFGAAGRGGGSAGSSASSSGGGGGGRGREVPGGPAGGTSDAAAGLAECFGSFPAGSWWLDASPLLPADLAVTLVWTPEATYLFLQVGAGRGEG
jgi:hypothetical protein